MGVATRHHWRIVVWLRCLVAGLGEDMQIGALVYFVLFLIALAAVAMRAGRIY